MDEYGAISGPGQPEGLAGRSSPSASPKESVTKLGEGVRQVRLGDLHLSVDEFSTSQGYYEHALELLELPQDRDLIVQTKIKPWNCCDFVDLFP